MGTSSALVKNVMPILGGGSGLTSQYCCRLLNKLVFIYLYIPSLKKTLVVSSAQNLYTVSFGPSQ